VGIASHADYFWANPLSVVFRALQGLGGSGLYTLTQIGMVEIGPVHRPGLIGALIGATLSISFVLGPILGGAITSKASWPWIFSVKYAESWNALETESLMFYVAYRSVSLQF
jgi:MFS family permease